VRRKAGQQAINRFVRILSPNKNSVLNYVFKTLLSVFGVICGDDTHRGIRHDTHRGIHGGSIRRNVDADNCICNTRMEQLDGCNNRMGTLSDMDTPDMGCNILVARCKFQLELRLASQQGTNRGSLRLQELDFS